MHKHLKKSIISCSIIGAGIIASISGVSADRLLRLNCKGEDVKALQQILFNKTYLKAAPTGHFGELTYAAVRNFQRDSALAIDGLVGINTRLKLNIASGKPTVSVSSEEDIYWLSRIIHAEAQGESYAGKIAVGAAVLNRVASPVFPNTVKGVIFEKTNGITQYTPTANGMIYKAPNAESGRAAKAVLSGENNIGNCTYFFNPAKAAGSWIVNNKRYFGRVGNHTFYY